MLLRVRYDGSSIVIGQLHRAELIHSQFVGLMNNIISNVYYNQILAGKAITMVLYLRRKVSHVHVRVCTCRERELRGRTLLLAGTSSFHFISPTDRPID